MSELSARADKVQSRAVAPEEDNMLKVATHGRMAALDLRLLGRSPGEDAKLVHAATRIAAIHHASVDSAYPDSEITGSLQLVFCDLGTPQARAPHSTGLAGGWNVYDELKQLLTDRGVPAGKIRFIHEARNDKEKGELFAAARNGRVSVLLGSTEKMGVGTNVQARAVALHHLDCPWRPADIAQREGRILRQGNLNPEVEILRYVTEGSFDAYLWHTVERKARFIGPGHARPARCTRDRRHRRHRPVLRRSQGTRHRRPAHPGKGPRRRRADPPGTARTRRRPQPAGAVRDHQPSRTGPALSWPQNARQSTRRSHGESTPAARSSR